MNKPSKARKHNSPRLQAILDEVTPLEMAKTQTKMQLSAQIEDLIRMKGWNKSVFAEKVGKNPSEITKWLSGTHNFTIDVLTEISVCLGVELAALLGKKQEKSRSGEWIVVKHTGIRSEVKLTTLQGKYKAIQGFHPDHRPVKRTTRLKQKPGKHV